MDGIIDSLREGLGINSSTKSVTNNSAANNSGANNLSRNNSAANNMSRNNSAANTLTTRNSSNSRRSRDTLPSLKKTVPVGSALLSKPLKNSSTMTGGSRRRRRRTRKNKYRVIR